MYIYGNTVKELINSCRGKAFTRCQREETFVGEDSIRVRYGLVDRQDKNILATLGSEVGNKRTSNVKLNSLSSSSG